MKSKLFALCIAVLLFTLVFSGCLEDTKTNDETKQESYDTLTTEDIALIEWIENNLDEVNSVIASDHRLERMIETKGFTTTKDETYTLWTSENISGCIDELYGIGENYSFSNITHVLIDDIMLNNSLHISFTVEGINMTYESYDKFSPPIFELIHRVVTTEINPDTGEPEHWAEVYQVNWSFDSQSFIACGCGCCSGVDPNIVCLYHSKGDDIQKLINEDQNLSQNPDCALAGCSLGIKYIYCD